MSGRDGGRVGLGERGAERVARVYATLSMAYEAIVRVRERLPLFEQGCRVLVEQGRLRMAWVGEVDDHGWIVPVAHAGVTDGYLDDVRIPVRDVAEGRGPTGTAARKRQHVFVGDIATDERMSAWREAALARGHYLERVRSGAARMGDLIDAVLQLSRLSRRRLVRVPVDMSALASEIVAELQRGEPDRRVEVEIQDGLRAEADLALVQSVLQNLLANAYEFTSDTAHPRVRFGSVGEHGVHPKLNAR